MTKTIAALAVLSLGALSCGNLIEAKKAWAPQNDFAVEPVQEFPLETAELSSNSIVVWKRGVTVEDQNAFGALTQRLGQAKAAIGKLMAENPGVPGFIQLATRKGALEADVRARTGEIATLTTERATASSPRQAEIDARLVTLNQEKTAKEAELNGVLAQLAPLAPTLGPVVADLQAKKATLMGIIGEVPNYTAFFSVPSKLRLGKDEAEHPSVALLGMGQLGAEAHDFSSANSEILEVSYECHGGRLRFTLLASDGSRFVFNLARARYSRVPNERFPNGSISFYGAVKFIKNNGEVRNGQARFETILPAVAPSPLVTPSPAPSPTPSPSPSSTPEVSRLPGS